MNKKIIILLLSVILLLGVATPVLAKKTLPSATKSSGIKTGASTKGVTTKVSFTNYKRAIHVTFSNLSIAKSVTYVLTYTANGVEQAFGGSIADLSGTQQRDITLGTCSNGICRYDSGIKNAKFVVTTTLLNGKKVVKSFRLKI